MGADGKFHREQSFVDHLPQPVGDLGFVEVQPDGTLMGQRVKACPLGEGLTSGFHAGPSECFEKRMSRCYPFQVIVLRSVPVGR